MIRTESNIGRKLFGRFCFADMFHRGKNVLVLYPLASILIGVIFVSVNEDLFWVFQIMCCLCIATPIFMVAISTMTFHRVARSYPENGKLIVVEFCEEGFYLGGSEKSGLLSYSTVKECVEFREFFILYFNVSSPVVIAKDGFATGSVKEFRKLMKKSIAK